MRILPLDRIKDKLTLMEKDENGREITLYQLSDVFVVGDSLSYPNALLYEVGSDRLFRPINEKAMSLKDVSEQKDFDLKLIKDVKTYNGSVFFFIYNTDNYYHFIYDSLPYIISYNRIKQIDPSIKLLMNYPDGKDSFYKFVLEFLALVGITENDIEIVDGQTMYSIVLLSNSYTHDFDSNLPPRQEVYRFFKSISDDFISDNSDLPKKIYISRRSWIHGDLSNIGTNYTTRRKMVNEDELVCYLLSQGYTEVFTETLSTKEKIAMFANAESVIGAIGGGICNVLFSRPECKLTAIISPYFLDVNERFLHSLNKVNLSLFKESNNTETSDFKKFMRVKSDEIVGEITDINGDELTIAYSDVKVSGWNSQNEFKMLIKNSNECVKLDNGLNSSWEIDLNKFKELYG